jgi:putative transposase
LKSGTQSLELSQITGSVLFGRGMSTREIQSHLEEIYGVEVSPALISDVTSAVQEEVQAWQHRALESRYAIVYMDALYVKMRDNGHVKNRAVYVAIGVNLEGSKEVLGLWSSDHEGSKFWLQVVTELRNWGVEDIFIAWRGWVKRIPRCY